MNLEKNTVKMTVSKILKKCQQSIGPDLYEFFVKVPTIHPKRMAVEKTLVVGPVFCVTEKHYLPTPDGYKPAGELRKGDDIIFSLDLIVK